MHPSKNGVVNVGPAPTAIGPTREALHASCESPNRAWINGKESIGRGFCSILLLWPALVRQQFACLATRPWCSHQAANVRRRWRIRLAHVLTAG